MKFKFSSFYNLYEVITLIRVTMPPTPYCLDHSYSPNFKDLPGMCLLACSIITGRWSSIGLASGQKYIYRWVNSGQLIVLDEYIQILNICTQVTKSDVSCLNIMTQMGSRHETDQFSGHNKGLTNQRLWPGLNHGQRRHQRRRFLERRQCQWTACKGRLWLHSTLWSVSSEGPVWQSGTVRSLKEKQDRLAVSLWPRIEETIIIRSVWLKDRTLRFL